jgi:alpha-2-macroglobulin
MRTRIAVACLVLGLATLGAALAQELLAPTELDQAAKAMADRDYVRAGGLLTAYLGTGVTGQSAEEAGVLLVRAKILVGDFEAALDAGREFLSAHRGSSYELKVRYLMADAYSRMRGFEDAARIYWSEVEFLSGDAHLRKVAGTYLELARRAYEGEEQPDEFGRPKLVKDFKRALEYYLKARSIHEDADQAASLGNRIATCHFELRDFAAAVAEWKTLLTKYPKSEWVAEANYFSGLALHLTGDDFEARKLLRVVIDEHPDTKWAPLAWEVLGRTFRPEETKDEYELTRGTGIYYRFLELYPSHELAESVAFRIGTAWYKFGRFDEAIENYGLFLKTYPDAKASPYAQDRIARAYYQKQDFDRAAAEWKTFLGKWPNHQLWGNIQQMISACSYEKGLVPLVEARKAPEHEQAPLLAQAVKGFTAFLSEFPVHAKAAEAQYLLGEIAHMRKDYAGAIEAWRVVASKYADTGLAPAALFRVAGVTEKDLGDLEQAIKEYEGLTARYASSKEAGLARKLLGELRRKFLEVETERVFRTDEACVLKIRSRNIEKLSIKAFRVDAEETFRRKLMLGGIEDVAVVVVDPVKSIDAPTEGYEKYRTFTRDVPLGLTGPGAWIVTVEEQDLSASTLVLVSDLTLITKQAKDQTLVFAVDSRTGRPAPGARVLVADPEGVKVEGVTGQDGVCLFDRPALKGEARVFANLSGHVASTGVKPGSGVTFGYATKVYLYTDRPLYRPGHEVKFRGIYRKTRNGAYVTAEGEELSLEVRDPRDTVIFEDDVKVSEFGTFTGEAWLPQGAALGTYRILATSKTEGTFTGAFNVEEYKKPEFTITARTDRRTYLPGERVKLDLALKYFFGGAVPHTPVRYTIVRGPFSFDPASYDEFAWFTKDPARERERENREASGFKPISAGEVVTDADGSAEIEFSAEDRDEDARYLVLIEALDLNRQWVRETASATISRQGFYAIAKAEKKVYRPGEEISVRLTTVDAVHFPIEAEGEMVVSRLGRAEGRGTESEVLRKNVKTGPDGRGVVKLSVSKPGEYVLRFVGQDRAEHPVTGQVSVTIAGETEDLSRHARLVAARQIYREGETAEVLVNSPVAPVHALLTFEGERVLKYEVVRLTGRSNNLTLPMDGEFSPNVFLQIAIPGQKELFTAGDEIFVLKYLDVTVRSDREEARPGEEVDFTVTARDHLGNPVSAELSLALIDQAVLALQPDLVPQIKPFFYDRRRGHAVNTGSSHSFKYAGITRPTNQDLLWEKLRLEGPEKFNRTMRYVAAGKLLVSRGDLEGAIIEFQKALQVSPDNYEAKSLRDRCVAELQARRHLEKLRRHTSQAMEPGEEGEYEDAEGGGFGARGGKAAPRRKRSSWGEGAEKELMDSLEVQKDKKYRGPGGEVPPGMRDPTDPAAPPVAATKNPSAGAFFNDAGDGDYRGRTENLFKNAILPELASAMPRKRFADTAAWAPRVVTGRDGTAVVKVELPDNLTTWRATVRGVDRKDLVGEGYASLLVRKDLLVRIDTPRFLTRGDRTTITATVHNDLGAPIEVRLGLLGENVTIEGPAEVVAMLAAGEIRAEDFRLVAADRGLVKLTAAALAREASDAAESGVYVLPHGLRTLIGRSGHVTEQALETFDLPEGILPGTKRLAVTLSPGIDGSIIESLVYLDQFPYGCLEQTVNRFLPAIAADRALRKIGSPNAKLKAGLSKAVERGLLALYAFQNDDGSFGWFSGRRMIRDRKAAAGPDPVMTSLALLAMEWSRAEGYRVSKGNRERAVAAATRMLKGTKNNSEKAYLLLALASSGEAPLEDLNQVYRYRDGLDSHALATLALAMVRSDRQYNAISLTAILRSRAIAENGLVHWAGSRRHGAMNDVETTAYALRALLAVDPATDLVDGAARWLIANRRGRKWTSTRDTGAAVVALSNYLLQRNVEQSDFTLDVFLNDGEVPYQKVHVAGGKIAGDQSRTILVDGARLRTGENRIRFVKHGPGSLFYTLMLETYTESEKIAPAGNLIALDRSFVEYVAPVSVKPGEEQIRPGYSVVRPDARPANDLGAMVRLAGSGDKFRVRLTVTAREALSYVIIEDPLPAGVEVISGMTVGPVDWEERRDEKQVFFLSNVPQGETEITYVVQAIHPGEYDAMPAMAWPMYEPAIWGRSGINELTVVPEAGAIKRGGGGETLTPDEIYHLAVRDFAEGDYAGARQSFTLLIRDFKLMDEYLEESLALLMRASFNLSDHQGAVKAYERLRELNPRRGPKTTAERTSLATAYYEIREYERALALFTGVVDEYFTEDVAVAETYRSIGNPYLAQEYTERLLRSYPDSNAVIDQAYRTALRYLDLRVIESGAKDRVVQGMDTGLMLPEALAAYRRFLADYPDTPWADDAARTIVTILNRMELFDVAVTEAESFIARYPDSVHLDDVTWYLAEAWFRRDEFGKAMEVGQRILDGMFRVQANTRELKRSPFVPHVKYLFARIHHLKGELDKAVTYYRAVESQFEDARDALAFLTQEEVRVPESAVFAEGTAPVLDLSAKNIGSFEMRIYPVDLMLLVAVKKDLSKAHEIDLTGIAPAEKFTRTIPGGEDHRWHDVKIPLGARTKGAYLVVLRTGDIVRTSVVLVSNLTVSVQRTGNAIRVYAENRDTREPVGNVFIKVTDGKTIRGRGFTDARGVFLTEGFSGPVIVVAGKDGHDALIRR